MRPCSETGSGRARLHSDPFSSTTSAGQTVAVENRQTSAAEKFRRKAFPGVSLRTDQSCPARPGARFSLQRGGLRHQLDPLSGLSHGSPCWRGGPGRKGRWPPSNTGPGNSSVHPNTVREAPGSGPAAPLRGDAHLEPWSFSSLQTGQGFEHRNIVCETRTLRPEKSLCPKVPTNGEAGAPRTWKEPGC